MEFPSASATIVCFASGIDPSTRYGPLVVMVIFMFSIRAMVSPQWAARPYLHAAIAPLIRHHAIAGLLVLRVRANGGLERSSGPIQGLPDNVPKFDTHTCTYGARPP